MNISGCSLLGIINSHSLLIKKILSVITKYRSVKKNTHFNWDIIDNACLVLLIYYFTCMSLFVSQVSRQHTWAGFAGSDTWGSGQEQETGDKRQL